MATHNKHRKDEVGNVQRKKKEDRETFKAQNSTKPYARI